VGLNNNGYNAAYFVSYSLNPLHTFTVNKAREVWLILESQQAVSPFEYGTTRDYHVDENKEHACL
jgi:hypothetical protein